MDKSSILTNLESALDEPRRVIGSTGSIASGKSTFLSALHAVLSYDKVGIKIDKDTLRGRSRQKIKPEAYKRLHKGIFRTNATVRPDSMPVYGVIDDKVYAFQFYAPGAHLHAVELKENIDGLLYFVDLNLAKFCSEALEREKTLRFGNHDVRLHVHDGDISKEIERMIDNAIEYNTYQPEHTEERVFNKIKKGLGVKAEGTDTVEDLAEFLASTAVKDIPMFGLPVEAEAKWVEHKEFTKYKSELLGEVVQSIIDSHKYAELKLSEGIPVIGVGTHNDKVYGKFPQDREGILKAVQDNFNRTIAKYREYQAEQVIRTGDFTIDLVNGLAIDWHFVELLRRVKVESKFLKDLYRDVLNTKNKRVLEIAHNIMAKTLQQRGVEAEGFKIVTFSNSQSDLTTHYA